jgi:hypothetical protein
MKLATCALVLVAGLAGCTTQTQSSSTGAPGGMGVRTEVNSRMCQVLRSYQGRGEDQWLREACTRHLGEQDCIRCLASGL